MALAAVMTQYLLPKVGGGRIPAVELLMVGYGARQHIRKNALQHLHQEMTITRKDGSCTIEDPIEYDHAHQRSIVEQVEIGVDAPDFPTALRSAVRQHYCILCVVRT